MSGGSYDYAFRVMEEMASAIVARHPTSPLHLAFARHLQKVALAAHQLEWVDSFDMGPGDEHAAIRAVLAPGAEVELAIDVAEKARAVLTAVIEQARGLSNPPKPEGSE